MKKSSFKWHTRWPHVATWNFGIFEHVAISWPQAPETARNLHRLRMHYDNQTAKRCASWRWLRNSSVCCQNQECVHLASSVYLSHHWDYITLNTRQWLAWKLCYICQNINKSLRHMELANSIFDHITLENVVVNIKSGTITQVGLLDYYNTRHYVLNLFALLQ